MPLLVHLPQEILECVALFLTLDDDSILGPPSSLIPLLQTCTSLNRALSPLTNTHFGATLFKSHFDYAAILRRQPALVISTRTVTEQLVLYCNAMRVIRTGNIWHEKAVDALWVAFLMLLESDGKNAIQLAQWANAYQFAQRWIFERLYQGAENNKGWPIATNENGLALWVMWMLTTNGHLQSESAHDRQRLIDAILPFCVMSYRYASFHCPPNHFVTPVKEMRVLFPTLPQDGQDAPIQLPTHPFPYSLITAHGPYPLYLDPSQATVRSWWALDIPFSQIACGLPSTLLYFCRRDRTLPIPGLPLNRQDALAQGREGLTAEDVAELASFQGTVLPPHPVWDPSTLSTTAPNAPSTSNSTVPPYTSAINPHDDYWNSARWDIDWIRWTSCIDPRRERPLDGCVPFQSSRPHSAGLREARLFRPRRECYDLGSLAGLWQGKFILQDEARHVGLLTAPVCPAGFGENSLSMFSFPILMRLREYHCISPRMPVPKGCPREGVHRGSVDQPAAPAGTARVSRLPGFDDGAQNAWLPWGTKRIEHGEALVMTVDEERYVYERHCSMRPSFRAHDPHTCVECAQKRTRLEWKRREHGMTYDQLKTRVSAHEHLFESAGLAKRWDDGTRELGDDDEDEEDCTGVTDVVFAGETDPHHGEAWHQFYFYGRLRRWDGLIGLLRIAPTPGFGAMFFHGYLVGSRNFVGQWRMASTEMGVPAWMCAFSMSKREDD